MGIDGLGVGDEVMIDSYEGFGGRAKIIEERLCKGSRFRVEMHDNNPPPFWAHDFEVSPIDPETDHESRRATRNHINDVRLFLLMVVSDLERRMNEHDQSKLNSPEVELFDEYTPKLKGCTFGSAEYHSYLKAMKPALDHHYAANSHHPEHYPAGIRGMSLIDMIEMLCDWLAATRRHADGDIRRSIDINQKRFGYSDELRAILLNTLPVIEQ